MMLMMKYRPELFLKIYDLFQKGEITAARQIQDACCQVIYKLCSGKGNMYAMIKEVLKLQGAPDLGGVRAPLYPVQEGDLKIAADAAEMIQRYIGEFV